MVLLSVEPMWVLGDNGIDSSGPDILASYPVEIVAEAVVVVEHLDPDMDRLNRTVELAVGAVAVVGMAASGRILLLVGWHTTVRHSFGHIHSVVAGDSFDAVDTAAAAVAGSMVVAVG